jgi:signal transduction histidine kinase
MGFALALLLTIGCIGFVLIREARGVPRPGGLRGHIRDRAWALLLAPIAMCAAVMASGAHGLILAELGGTALAIVFVPKLAARLVPYGLFALAVTGVKLARTYNDGKLAQVQYVFVHAGWGTWGGPPVLAEAGLLSATGLWLLLRLHAPGAGPVRALAARWLDSGRGGISAVQALLLIPVVGLTMQLLGPGDWFGFRAIHGLDAAVLDLAMLAGALVLIFRSRPWAATLAAAGLLVLGVYGWVIAVFWPVVPGFGYALVDLQNSPPHETFWGAGLEASVLLAAGLWLAPRVARHHLAGAPDPELAARARQLTQRVQTLTQTRYDAVDTAAAELRRIERDLHDGAQARLVALGMSLRAAERIFEANPEAALALVTEARHTSSRALIELRDLVRGIYPPVLADRGLGDAVRALALDSPLPTVLDVDLPGTVEMPVASAVYFSVAEVLANVAKHAAARTVRISLSHDGGMLRAQITDDGAGGADPALGTGLAGVERRLATFDGILAVSSPPGGPTIIVIEVPCALSSPKTFSC